MKVVLFAMVVTLSLGGCQWACEGEVYKSKQDVRKFMQKNCDSLVDNVSSMYKESLEMERRLSTLRCE